MPTFLAQVLGFDTVDVTGRAVASREVLGGFVTYAGKVERPDNGDRNLDGSGSDDVVIERTHSNGDIKVGGSDHRLGPTT